MALRRTYVELLRSTDSSLFIPGHLAPVRNPTREAANREQYGEHPRWKAHSLIDDPGIKVDVGIETPLLEIVVLKRNGLAFPSDIKERILDSEGLQTPRRALLHQLATGVVVFVQSVTQPHQT
ncbi:hypothetical protein VT73_00825, partial [Rathayibacter toxicus]